jgi:hypothetical protein
MDQCRLVISNLDPKLHFGEWTCRLEAWNAKGRAKVVVKQSQPKVVEFLKIIDDVVVNVGEPSFI